MRKESVRAVRGGWGLWGIVALALGIPACAPHVASVTPSTSGRGRSGLCELLAAPPAAAASLRIAVTDALTPGDAPLPRTDAERVIFPLLYTPTGTASRTCHDRSDSTLAESVDATRQREATAGSPGDTARTAVPPPTPAPGGEWPATAGRYEIIAASDTALDLAARRGTSGPALHVTRIPVDGGRDALDGGTDVLITSDATTIAYAAARADFVSVPLPWSRAYVLILANPPVHADRDTVRALGDDLATDAVRVEARGVDGAEWADALATCDTAASPGRVVASDASHGPVASPSAPEAPLANRIVYAQSDNVARAVSERLVALANERDPRLAAVAPALVGRPAVRAAGFDSAQMRAALSSGRDAAYVAWINATDICRGVAMLMTEAPWVGSDLHGVGPTLAPLIETRAHAIVRRGRVGVAIDGAGNVYLESGPVTGS